MPRLPAVGRTARVICCEHPDYRWQKENYHLQSEIDVHNLAMVNQHPSRPTKNQNIIAERKLHACRALLVAFECAAVVILPNALRYEEQWKTKYQADLVKVSEQSQTNSGENPTEN